MTQGVNVDSFDSSIRPADDLFRHVNGPWLDTTQIKPDRATAGSFVDLVDAAEEITRDIIERCAKDPASDEERKIGELYTSYLDTDTIAQRGSAVLDEDFSLIDSVETITALAPVLGTLERRGVAGLAGMYVAPNRGKPDEYIVHLVQGGLGLPDESYYRDGEFAEIRNQYRTHLARMFALAGLDDDEARADRVLELETSIAAAHWDRVACRDTQATYNPMSRSEWQGLASAFDWAAWAQHADISENVLANVIVSQPSFFTGLNELLTEQRLAAWLDWLRWQLLRGASSYLTDDFIDAQFDFYGRTLQGTDEIRPRWKRAVSFVEGTMGEAIGKIYVREHYGPEAAARMNELIANLIAAYHDSITALDWMSEETKERALAKLEAFRPKIGHPQEFRDYSALVTDPADLIGNARRAMNVEMDRELAKIGQPIDLDEWYMTPQTVNAYYNPTMNEIVFPAAILQPPFFSLEADDAVNYGAIGAVIGHEIGHGFDDQGSQYDGTGALNNWWTDADRAAFEERTAALIAQYDGLEPEGADGHTVNGSLTIGENIGDLGGLSIAYKAYRMSVGDQEPALIDGLTGDQRLFISWAQAWRSKVRPAETIRRLTIDPHSPPEFRCNQVVRNIDAFHEAFSVTQDDAMWLDPAERVRIW